jgi:hypothetical protein
MVQDIRSQATYPRIEKLTTSILCIVKVVVGGNVIEAVQSIAEPSPVVGFGFAGDKNTFLLRSVPLFLERTQYDKIIIRTEHNA